MYQIQSTSVVYLHSRYIQLQFLQVFRNPFHFSIQYLLYIRIWPSMASYVSKYPYMAQHGQKMSKVKFLRMTSPIPRNLNRVCSKVFNLSNPSQLRYDEKRKNTPKTSEKIPRLWYVATPFTFSLKLWSLKTRQIRAFFLNILEISLRVEPQKVSYNGLFYSRSSKFP